MNLELEQKYWNAGQDKESYSKKNWHEIIHALLDNFKEFIGQDFQRYPGYSLHLERPDYPCFCIWFWIEDEKKSFVSTVWLAVMGGEMIADTEKGKVFSSGITMFLFDPITKKRCCLMAKA